MTINTRYSARRRRMYFSREEIPQRIKAFRAPNENRFEWNTPELMPAVSPLPKWWYICGTSSLFALMEYSSKSEQNKNYEP